MSKPAEPAPSATLYTVRNGDTLMSIALQFDVTVSWVKQCNRLLNDLVFAGDTLDIPPMPSTTIGRDPVDVCIYGETGGDVPGKLLVIGDEVRFEPMSRSVKPRDVKLVDHVHHILVPHPCAIEGMLDADDPNSLYLLAIVYMPGHSDVNSVQTVYFAGMKGLLERFGAMIDEAATAIQQREHVILPSLHEITDVTADRSRRTDEDTVRHGLSVGSLPARRTQVIHTDLPGIELIGGPSLLIDDATVLAIRRGMPRIWREHHWASVFRLSVDGCSFVTLYSKARGACPLVLVAKNDDGDRFGAFLSCELKPAPGFQGNGHVFVFRIDPAYQAYPWNRGAHGNNHFIGAGMKELVIGAGGGSAIFLGADMLMGRSDPCGTFGSPSLTKRDQFKIVDVEIWRVTGVS
jgi:hypothetical protein